jgi:hypothetical protein
MPTARCSCGSVEIEAFGAPITSAVCYCDSCQEGSRQIEALTRVVATCCNSAMVMRFDDAKHWVPVYRARFQGDMLPVQWRICTKYKPENAVIPTDAPSSAMYPGGFMWQLLTSRISMLFR